MKNSVSFVVVCVIIFGICEYFKCKSEAKDILAEPPYSSRDADTIKKRKKKKKPNKRKK